MEESIEFWSFFGVTLAVVFWGDVGSSFFGATLAVVFLGRRRRFFGAMPAVVLPPYSREPVDGSARGVTWRSVEL